MTISSGVKYFMLYSAPCGVLSHRKCAQSAQAGLVAFAGNGAARIDRRDECAGRPERSVRRLLDEACLAFIGRGIGSANHDVLTTPAPHYGRVKVNLCSLQDASRWPGFQFFR